MRREGAPPLRCCSGGPPRRTLPGPLPACRVSLSLPFRDSTRTPSRTLSSPLSSCFVFRGRWTRPAQRPAPSLPVFSPPFLCVTHARAHTLTPRGSRLQCSARVRVLLFASPSFPRPFFLYTQFDSCTVFCVCRQFLSHSLSCVWAEHPHTHPTPLRPFVSALRLRQGGESRGRACVALRVTHSTLPSFSYFPLPPVSLPLSPPSLAYPSCAHAH